MFVSVTKSRVWVHSTTTPMPEVVWAVVYERFATSFAEAMSLPSYILMRPEEDSEATISIDLDTRYLVVISTRASAIAGPYSYAELRFDYRDN